MAAKSFAEKIIMDCLSETGSTWMREEALRTYLTQKRIGIEVINNGIVKGDVILYQDNAGKRFLTTGRIHFMEHSIAENLLRIKYARIKPISEETIRRYVADFEREQNEGRSLHEHQVDAVVMVVNNNLSILTGGPGTGKTTVLSAITYVLRRLHSECQIVFTAPTGKAARRISESTGEAASTVNKKIGLGYDNTDGETFFEDVLFVDEFSMNDTSLTYALSKNLPTGKKVVFVGDVDQLPSVGPGAVLRDLIASGVIPVTMLTKTFRQDDESGLFENIKRIKTGDANLISSYDFHPFVLKSDVTISETEQRILMTYEQEVKKYGVENVCVLLPYRKNGLCSNAMSNKLQRLANPQKTGYRHCSQGNGIRFFCTGDFVMQLENRDECSNGDVGQVVSLSPSGMDVKFSSETVRYGLDELEQLCLAYAMTIHKSQGSEYASVIVGMLDCHKRMLNRNLLYTGVTRAKKECTLFYQQGALETALKTIATASRLTMLREELIDVNESYQN